jgi:hypothetical protein
MIRGNITNSYFQTFYASKEESNCPLITDSIRIGKKLKENGKTNIIISQRYGKRVLINSMGDFEKIKTSDFIEIVDFDPVKNILLVMGNQEPRVNAPLHWFIFHARSEINAIIQINDLEIIEKIKKFPTTKNEYPICSIDQIKDVMKCLRKSKNVIIKNQGALFVGNSLNDVEKFVIEEIL